jgi:5-methylcytosine-specific restriction enzyme subunit McrC
MTVLTLAEYGDAVTVPLDDPTGQALVSSGLVDAAPDPYLPGQWRVSARNKVGVATVAVPGGQPLTLRIAPKVPIRRLLFLLGYSRNPKGWRDDDVQVAEEPKLLPALARLFARQAEHALRQGLLQGYRTTEETTLLVRGRIREADQIRRQHGRLLPVKIVHDEYTTDIAENQLLRTASERLCRLPVGIPDEVRSRLLRLSSWCGPWPPSR